MGKVASIAKVQERVRQREPAEAVRELHDAITTANTCMQVLAEMYPGCTFLAGIDRGQPCGALAYSRSAQFDHFTPGAMDAAKSLAEVVASLLPELAEVFKIEIDTTREVNRLRAEMAKAYAALALEKQR